MDGSPPGSTRLQAVDWSGRSRGHIDIPVASTAILMPPILQSPDGERLLVSDTVYASDGRRLFATPALATRDRNTERWADDDRGLCLLTVEHISGAYSIRVVSATGVMHHALQVPPIGLGDAGYVLEACSVRTDRAVIYRWVDAEATQVFVVRIGTGAVLLHESFCNTGDCSGNVVGTTVSANARHAAEMTRDGLRFRDLNTGHVAMGPKGGRWVFPRMAAASCWAPADFFPGPSGLPWPTPPARGCNGHCRWRRPGASRLSRAAPPSP